MKAYQAYGAGNTATAPTPRQAAEKFFRDFPQKRKCNVTEGEADGHFFTIAYTAGRLPKRFKDVTRKSATSLPDEA